MKILLVCATTPEIEKLLLKLDLICEDNKGLAEYQYRKHHISILITGIGCMNTSYRLMKAIQYQSYDLILNVGIAGSFSPHIKVGQVVFVEEEVFADLGIEDQNGLHSLFEMNLLYENQFPFRKGKLMNQTELPVLSHLNKARSITVNTAHGSTESIRFFLKKFGADIENMEGAAFTFVCLMEKQRFAQIRSISNHVEPRDFSKWNIPLAVESLTRTIVQLLDSI